MFSLFFPRTDGDATLGIHSATTVTHAHSAVLIDPCSFFTSDDFTDGVKICALLEQLSVDKKSKNQGASFHAELGLPESHARHRSK
jgi:hypothetical protein